MTKRRTKSDTIAHKSVQIHLGEKNIIKLGVGLWTLVPWNVSSFCSTSGTNRVILVRNSVVIHEKEMNSADRDYTTLSMQKFT